MSRRFTLGQGQYVFSNHDAPPYRDGDKWAEYNMRFFADDREVDGVDKDAIDQETLDRYVSFA